MRGKVCRCRSVDGTRGGASVVRYSDGVPGRSVYDLLYRLGAARWKRGWDAGPGPELVALVTSGVLTPNSLGGNRAIDLGCGAGANTVFLANHGFQATGVDFSPAAIQQAGTAAAGDRTQARFIVGDVTSSIDGVEGPFDLVLLYNVVQDLDDRGRAGIAEVTRKLGRPGTAVLLWCWFQRKSLLPLISYRGPSRIAPFVIEPGEERRLFPEDLYTYAMPEPQPGSGRACFLLTRRG